ncbi:MAG: cytochrome c [Rhodothermales bacterium]|nr:cytochrome c [Rhodothermales bacterium]
MTSHSEYRTLLAARLVLVALLLAPAAGCGSGDGDAPATPPAATPSSTTGGLTEAQLTNGIGPVTQLTLGPIDADLARRGEESFKMKCMACHKFDERYVGPALGDVLTRRTPEYVMNMMLNPAEMVQKHPEARAMLAQYMTPMPSQNLTEDEARALLEYMRTAAEEPEEDEENEETNE